MPDGLADQTVRGLADQTVRGLADRVRSIAVMMHGLVMSGVHGDERGR
jgi:hypothetical protein